MSLRAKIKKSFPTDARGRLSHGERVWMYAFAVYLLLFTVGGGYLGPFLLVEFVADSPQGLIETAGTVSGMAMGYVVAYGPVEYFFVGDQKGLSTFWN